MSSAPAPERRDIAVASRGPARLPAWADYILIPILNLTAAFVVAGIVVLLITLEWQGGLLSTIGEAFSILGTVVQTLLYGAFGYGEGFGFTLYYATNFALTGLGVAVAFHAGLFNIGGEGQAYLGGLGVALVALAFDMILPWWLVFPLAIISAALFGAAWAFLPAWLQARFGSHVVITTIMFNFIAASLMVWLLSRFLKVPTSMAVETRTFGPGGTLPRLDWLFAAFGGDLGGAPANVTVFVALAAAAFVYFLIWRTRLGYEMRTVGLNPVAAVYAGISVARITILTMLISGGLSGLMAMNNIMGEQQRLQIDFVAGAGFVGIAVALMGRAHPVGILFAAILFGVLYQGGAELAFEMPAITRDMIVVIQGLVILFAGALENMFRPALLKAFALMPSPRRRIADVREGA